MSHFPEARNVTSSCETRRNRGELLLRNNIQSPLYIVKDVEQLRRSKQHGGILRAARGVYKNKHTQPRMLSSLFNRQVNTSRIEPFHRRVSLKQMRPFSLTQVFLFVLTATDALGSRTKCAKYLQFPPWLIPNSMRKGVRSGGEGKGSDLEELMG